MPMRIALDYDRTYTLHPALWDAFLVLLQHNGHDCRVVTARSPVLDRTEALVELERKVPVIYTNGIAKHFHCTHWTCGWEPDVWIDDKVVNILHNSTTSPEDLVKWRTERDEGPSFPLGDTFHPVHAEAAYAGLPLAGPGDVIVIRSPDSGGLEFVPVDEALVPEGLEPVFALRAGLSPIGEVFVRVEPEHDPEVSRMVSEGGPGRDHD